MTVFGQNSTDLLLSKLEISQALYPPKDILSTKSIVLISVPEDADRNEWMESVDELQQFFAEEGIDAVAYIETEVLFSQPNDRLTIPEFLRKRGINNLILFAAGGKKGPVFLAIGPYNGEENFFDKGATFWAREGANLDGIKDELSAYFKTGAIYRGNLLVNENAEFFYPEVDLGVVAKSVPPKIADFKVAIERIDKALLADQGPAAFRYANFYNQVRYDSEITGRERWLNSLHSDTTNNFYYKEEKQTNQQLRKDGFQYELRYVSAPENLLYDWISFPDRKKPRKALVHKFYLSDLRNNNIYVGKNWDAALDWEAALQNFLGQIQQVIQENAN
ncbi:hypothetical protein BFP71_05580 [Roseivirga misakiensis]|uniref:Uncharacterized protein n=2 Tax=Roseivirga misakiensis TaxID=1563681 RepID=A0A1E5T705_9BACT|nr:hypothetical protein BFP71_05580 [Roseivirga misakiensis]